MREALIEAEGKRYAEARGWTVYKWSSPGTSGILDRLHFKAGLCFAIEYKTTGKKATPKQRREAQRLQAAGIPARCCDSVQAARDIIDSMDLALQTEEPYLEALLLSRYNLESFSP